MLNSHQPDTVIFKYSTVLYIIVYYLTMKYVKDMNHLQERLYKNLLVNLEDLVVQDHLFVLAVTQRNHPLAPPGGHIKNASGCIQM